MLTHHPPSRIEMKTAIYHRKYPVAYVGNGKWEYSTEDAKVRVMASAEGYSMVRRKNCAPFVVQDKDLTFNKPPSREQDE